MFNPFTIVWLPWLAAFSGAFASWERLTRLLCEFALPGPFADRALLAPPAARLELLLLEARLAEELLEARFADDRLALLLEDLLTLDRLELERLALLDERLEDEDEERTGAAIDVNPLVNALLQFSSDTRKLLTKAVARL